MAAATVAQAVGDAPDRASFFPKPEHPAVHAELITEHASVQPGGRTRIGIHFELEEGWHIYAQDPGDAGLPTKVVWSGPNSITFGPLQWPPAQEFVDPGDIHTHGYSGAVVLWSTLETNPGTQAGRLDLQARVEWLACREICIPGSADLTLALPIDPAEPALSTHALLFEQVPHETPERP